VSTRNFKIKTIKFKKMKKTILFIATFLLLTVFTSKVKAQSVNNAQPSYKDMVGENTNAEADMKVVSDFVNALTSGDLVKAKSLLADDYKGYGPAPTDTSTVEKTIINWQENYKTQSDRKIGFVTQTFRVLQGDLKGDWVSLWGDYTFTENGKTITFPLQYTARVTNGKIDTDRVYYDRLYILQSLGYTLTPPATK
jgi:ketosteroid isomerase-like protein